MKSSKFFSLSLGVGLGIALLGCRGPKEELPNGWSEESHGDNAKPNYDLLFDLSQVHRLDIVLEAQVYEEMVTDASISVALGEDPLWVEAAILHDGRTWEHVGMRFKGLSSIENSLDDGSLKFPFRLSFDQFEDDAPDTNDQRFYGFKKMTFASNVKDDSLLHEVLASEVMRGMGVPAARAAFYQIHVDTGEGPVYWGLYTMVEDPSDVAMQESQLGGRDGNLYKPNGDGAAFVAFNEADFEKGTNEDVADFSDVQAAVKALLDQDSVGADFRSALEAAFDVDTFLRYLATNMAISNGDSYGCKARNYYLYGSPEADGRLVWIPWDQNKAFVGSMASCGDKDPGALPDTSESILYLEFSTQWPLISRILAEQPYREKYETYLGEVLEGAFEESSFSARATALHEMIEPYVVGDSGEVAPYTNLSSEAAFGDSLSGPGGLLEHVTSRHELVTSALGQ